MKPITRDDTEYGVLYYKASEVDAMLAARAAQSAQAWLPTTERMPPPGTPVLADVGTKFPIRACWVAKFSEELGASDFQGEEDYDEKTDTSYWPEGWYEWNSHEETHWYIDAPVLNWMPLPSAPKESP